VHVVICGAGAIGASIAYFLSRRGAAVTVVERAGVANAASGKSGGFLALDWCDGGLLEALARRSFALHAELAATLGVGKWGYRRMTTFDGQAAAGRQGSAGRQRAVSWASDTVAIERQLGTEGTTAQVHPALYTQAMMDAAATHGARLVAGEVTDITIENGIARGVAVNGEEALSADAVVIAMGPWSLLATRWLPLPPVFGLKGHSIVFATENPIPAEALFLEYRERNGAQSSPEVFPRADGTTYVCGISSETPLPLDPAEVAPDPGAIERLKAICADISPNLATAKVLKTQACFRPVTRDGVPLIGAVPGVANAFVATGHSVWGILNAPATGEAMAGLILDGNATLDLSPFAPGRMKPFDSNGLRYNA
jgi:glycine/D-amino acid oxidase-like deaminating enzyme